VIYPAKHGRPHESPWSLRQLSAYQKFDVNVGASRWIFLQLSEELQAQAIELASQYTWTEHSFGFFGQLHTMILSWTESNWMEYILWLETKLVEKVRIDFHSTEYLIILRVGRKRRRYILK
jgi:hypothetical protein